MIDLVWSSQALVKGLQGCKMQRRRHQQLRQSLREAFNSFIVLLLLDMHQPDALTLDNFAGSELRSGCKWRHAADANGVCTHAQSSTLRPATFAQIRMRLIDQ